jgi:hypothetical protein
MRTKRVLGAPLVPGDALDEAPASVRTASEPVAVAAEDAEDRLLVVLHHDREIGGAGRGIPVDRDQRLDEKVLVPRLGRAGVS